MVRLKNLSPDELVERARQMRELGDAWFYLLNELANALEALAQEKQQGRQRNPPDIG